MEIPLRIGLKITIKPFPNCLIWIITLLYLNYLPIPLIWQEINFKNKILYFLKFFKVQAKTIKNRQALKINFLKTCFLFWIYILKQARIIEMPKKIKTSYRFWKIKFINSNTINFTMDPQKMWMNIKKS